MPSTDTTTTAPNLADPRGKVWIYTGQERNGKPLYVIEGVNPQTCPRMSMSTRYELEQIFQAEMKPVGPQKTDPTA